MLPSIDELATVTKKSSKSLMRMLGLRGNPQARNFFRDRRLPSEEREAFSSKCAPPRILSVADYTTGPSGGLTFKVQSSRCLCEGIVPKVPAVPIVQVVRTVQVAQTVRSPEGQMVVLSCVSQWIFVDFQFKVADSPDALEVLSIPCEHDRTNLPCSQCNENIVGKPDQPFRFKTIACSESLKNVRSF